MDSDEKFSAIIAYLKDKLHLAVGMPAVISLSTFLTNLYSFFHPGAIDSSKLHQLLSIADGLEAFILFVVMLILKKNNT